MAQQDPRQGVDAQQQNKRWYQFRLHVLDKFTLKEFLRRLLGSFSMGSPLKKRQHTMIHTICVFVLAIFYLKAPKGDQEGLCRDEVGCIIAILFVIRRLQGWADWFHLRQLVSLGGRP